MKKVILWDNQNQVSTLAALVDDEDYEKVIEAIKYKNGEPGKWYTHKPPTSNTHYANCGSRTKAMHRIIMDTPKGMDTDHKNGNGLDNRKENLRICTRAQNSRNKKLRCDSASGYKGVYKYKGPKNLKKPYIAYVGDPATSFPNTRQLKLGYYATGEEAAAVRDKKALEVHGEFAYLNFPERLDEYLTEINK